MPFYKFLKNIKWYKVTEFVNKSGKWVHKHLPSILSIAGTAGVFVTGGLAIKAGYDMGKDDKVEPKKFILPIISGVATALCIVGSNMIHLRRNARLTVVSAGLLKYISDLENKIREKDGEYQMNDIQKEIAIDRVNSNPPPKDIETENGEILTYELFSEQYIVTTKEKYLNAVINLNKALQTTGEWSLNDFLIDIGGKENVCAIGDEIGWSVDSYEQIDVWNGWIGGIWEGVNLSERDVDGMDVYLITFDVNPVSLDEMDIMCESREE